MFRLQKPEFDDKKVIGGKEYEYRVTAVNAGGESDPSEVSLPIKAKPLKGISSLLSLSLPTALNVVAAKLVSIVRILSSQ